MRAFGAVGLMVVGVLAVSACGSNEAVADLPPAAAEGRDVYISNGCAACHGSNGDGGVGPMLAGVYLTEVPIEGLDEPVLADRDYLTESITDPSAKIHESYSLPMPRNNLSPDEVASIVDYIAALGDEGVAEDAP